MRRCHGNGDQRFSATMEVNLLETRAVLALHTAEMSKEWDGLDHGWAELEQQMIETGIVRPTAPKEGLVRLNVGGSLANFPRSILHDLPEREGTSSRTWSFADFIACDWDERLPRDKDGRIFLDESATCVKHLIQSVSLRGFRENASDRAVCNRVPGDELTYLEYVSNILGLPMVAPVPRSRVVTVTGGSSTLGVDEIGSWSAALGGWYPDGEVDGLELLYRATRDGWSASAFHRSVDPASSTFTLFRVGDREGMDSVVGGFSSVSWASRLDVPALRPSPGAFVFMLKDGSEEAPDTFAPVKWNIREGQEGHAVQCSPYFPAHFGQGSLTVVGGGSDATLWAKSHTFDTSAGSSLVRLHGQPVKEVEAFRVQKSKPREPTTPPVRQAPSEGRRWPPETNDAKAAAEDVVRDTIRFGGVIAGTLMEERAALKLCRDELSLAGERVSASSSAVAAIYGPHVAAGQKDRIVEIDVRGVRMATLRSTLQACPESPLALHFDEGAQPAAGEKVDQHGRWAVDCKPLVFSKILDVLRVRKRATWPHGACEKTLGGVGDSAPVVTLGNTDLEAFNDFVDTYFSGHESFIKDVVC